VQLLDQATETLSIVIRTPRSGDPESRHQWEINRMDSGFALTRAPE
jgi:hypothetical protein